jgi:hypothetical protein
MVALAVLSVVVGPAAALATPQTHGSAGKSGMLDYRSLEGKVTALDRNAKTLQVMPTDGSMSGPVRVAMGDQMVIHDGILPRTAADLKIGDDVNLMYSGTSKAWVADDINILDPSVPVARDLGPGVR